MPNFTPSSACGASAAALRNPYATCLIRLFFRTCLVLVPCLLLSCHLKPVERNFHEIIPLPARDLPGQEKTADPPDHWWEAFGRPDLNRLINQALSDSPDMAGASARLRRAEALSRAAAARQGPELTISGDLSATRSHAPFLGWSSAESRGAGLSLSHSLDIWGKLAADDGAALAKRDAARFEREAAALRLAAAISLQWITLLTETARGRLLRKRRKTNLTYLDLVELRFRNSLAPALDVFQQRQVVAAIASELPLSDLRITVSRHALAVLAGKTPDWNCGITDLELPALPPPPPSVLPARLLARRPDIRAAAARLLAADRDTVSARAGLLPAIGLSADFSLSASTLSDLPQSWLARLAAGITGPVWDRGRRRAAVDAAEAAADGHLAAYRDTGLTALCEAADALAREQAQAACLIRLNRELALAKSALAEARERYLSGITDYLSVLSHTRTLLSLEQEHIAARSALLEYRINLYTALGGGWHPEDLQKEPS
ncbi:MAG: hypothetical protein CSB33_04865 [Desulfobacterales bacterium]|nr:MAG: hypothetical protein CSB33_04865 [Desulfobacterales bacterium]